MSSKMRFAITGSLFFVLTAGSFLTAYACQDTEKTDKQDPAEKTETEKTEKTDETQGKTQVKTNVDPIYNGLYDTLYPLTEKAIRKFVFLKGTIGCTKKEYVKLGEYITAYNEKVAILTRKFEGLMKDEIALMLSQASIQKVDAILKDITGRARDGDNELFPDKVEDVILTGLPKVLPKVERPKNRFEEVGEAIQFLKDHHELKIQPMLDKFDWKLSSTGDFSFWIFDGKVQKRPGKSMSPNYRMDFRWMEITMTRLEAYQEALTSIRERFGTFFAKADEEDNKKMDEIQKDLTERLKILQAYFVCMTCDGDGRRKP